MVERVELNDIDKDQTLVTAVINDLIRRLSKRERLPFQSIKHFKDFENEQNTITVKLTNVPYPGVEAFTFLLIADRLNDLRPSYKETLGDKI